MNNEQFTAIILALVKSGGITQNVADSVIAASKYLDRSNQLVEDFGWIEPDTDTFVGSFSGFKLLRYKIMDDDTVLCELSTDVLTEGIDIPDNVLGKNIAEGSTITVLHNNFRGDNLSQEDTVNLVYSNGEWGV